MMFITQLSPDGGRELPPQALHLLLSFLGRSRQLEPDLRAELGELNIVIPDGTFQTAVFEIDEQTLTAREPLLHHRQRRQAFSRLSSDLSRAFAPEVGGFLFLAMGSLAGILFSETDAPQRLTQAVLETWQFQNSGSFTVSFSRRYADLSQTSMAWEEAFGRQRGRLYFSGMPSVLDGETLYQGRESLWSSRFVSVDRQLQQLAQRICGAILAGQAEQAGTILDEALDLILDEGVRMPQFVEIQMLGTLFAARLSSELRSAGVLQPDCEPEYDLAQQLLNCHDDQEFRAAAHTCLDAYICRWQKRQSERTGRLMTALREFLRENACNQQAGLGMAAEHFGVHPATLANGFRRTYGESVGDYINRTRVEAARALLQQGGTTVQAVSEQVGFCSGTTMYRAFIRYEGRSPRSFKGEKLPDAGSKTE